MSSTKSDERLESLEFESSLPPAISRINVGGDDAGSGDSDPDLAPQKSPQRLTEALHAAQRAGGAVAANIMIGTNVDERSEALEPESSVADTSSVFSSDGLNTDDRDTDQEDAPRNVRRVARPARGTVASNTLSEALEDESFLADASSAICTDESDTDDRDSNLDEELADALPAARPTGGPARSSEAGAGADDRELGAAPKNMIANVIVTARRNRGFVERFAGPTATNVMAARPAPLTDSHVRADSGTAQSSRSSIFMKEALPKVMKKDEAFEEQQRERELNAKKKLADKASRGDWIESSKSGPKTRRNAFGWRWTLGKTK
ncbi:hypothetical protein HK101_007333 [Irineochytrium annulatum]|nr:hypothetical protein HK101_007333 [Irineochytrium annulatum]